MALVVKSAADPLAPAANSRRSYHTAFESIFKISKDTTKPWHTYFLEFSTKHVAVPVTVVTCCSLRTLLSQNHETERTIQLLKSSLFLMKGGIRS
jgi:hypothetical protein